MSMCHTKGLAAIKSLALAAVLVSVPGFPAVGGAWAPAVVAGAWTPPPYVSCGLERNFNFGIVIEGRILRSRKPDSALLKYLKKQYGLTDIVDLRNPEYKDEGRDISVERELSGELGLNYHLATVQPNDGGNVAVIVKSIAARPGAVTLVHCHGGKDRTGMIAALLRLDEGWSYEEARLEMSLYLHEPEKDVGLHRWLRERFTAAGRPLEGVRPKIAARLRQPDRCRSQ